MAKKVTVELVDDMNGESGATTTRFGLDGVDYEIDLVDDQLLRYTTAPYIEKARKVDARNGGNGRSAATAAGAGNGRPDMHLIRRWARENGISIPARGRMPAATIRAYDEHRQAQQGQQ
jgi:hypothetical protein